MEARFIIEEAETILSALDSMDDKMSSTEIKNKARRVGNAKYLAFVKEERARVKERERENKRLQEERKQKEREAEAKRLKEEEEAKAKRLKEEEEARRIALEDKCNEERVKGWVKSNNFKGKLCKLWQITCVYSISSPYQEIILGITTIEINIIHKHHYSIIPTPFPHCKWIIHKTNKVISPLQSIIQQ